MLQQESNDMDDSLRAIAQDYATPERMGELFNVLKLVREKSIEDYRKSLIKSLKSLNVIMDETENDEPENELKKKYNL